MRVFSAGFWTTLVDDPGYDAGFLFLVGTKTARKSSRRLAKAPAETNGGIMIGNNRRFPLVLAASLLATTALAGCSADPQSQGSTSDSGGEGTVTIYLTRHGQTILNTAERAQGWSDSPLLNDAARAVPVTVGENIASREGSIDAAYSADMKRHHDTAALIVQGAGASGVEVVQDEGLRELAFGSYEGALAKEAWTALLRELGYSVDVNADPTAPADAAGQNGGWQTMEDIAMAEVGVDGTMAALERVSSTPVHDTTFPAEDCTDANERMAASLDEIAEDAVGNGDARVLVVSSGLTISCYLTLSHDTPTTGISNVGVSKLEYTGGEWTVVTVNDKSYQE